VPSPDDREHRRPTAPASVAGSSGRAAGLGRRATWAVVALGIVVVIAAAACTRWPVPKAFAERWLGERLQRTVTIRGDASLCLCPHPSVRVASIEVGPPEWSKRTHFARVTDAEIAISARSALSGRLRILSLNVGTGDVVLERTQDGRTSWQLGAPDADRSPDAKASGPVIERLEARDVRWRFVDPARGADLEGHLSLHDGSSTGTPAAMEMRARGKLRELPVNVSAQGGSVLAGAGAGPQPIRATAQVGKGRFEFDGTADSLTSMSGLNGGFRVSGPALAALGSLVGAVLPRTPPFQIEGRMHHVQGRWDVDIAKATVGGSDLRGKVAFEPGADKRPPRLSGNLASDRMSIADLGRSVGFGEKPDRSRLLPDVSLDLPSLSGMEANVKLAIKRLELGSFAPITDIGVDLALKGGVLGLGSLKAVVAGGRLAGDVRIDGTRTPGRTEAALKIDHVALQRWLPKLRGQAPLASRLNADLKLSGRGDSVADVLARADGRLRVALGPGEASSLVLEVAGLDVAESLAVLATKDRSVMLDCGLADIVIQNGVARPEVLMIDTRDTILVGEGSVDLAKERLDMRVRAAPRDFSPLTLRAPVNIGGTFVDPKVAIDRSRMAGTLIASAVLGAVVAPLAALLPLLDFGEGDPPSPCRERLEGRTKTPPPEPRKR
jgi:uncharacterized protein involved in outer membrane biogenesis